MVKTALVESEINEGRKLLELVEEEGVPVKAALWKRNESPEYWSLVLVTPLVDEMGERKALRRLLDILTRAPDRTRLELEDLALISPKSPFAKSVHREFRTGRDRPIGSLRIGDERIDDGYLYFAK